MGFRFLPIAFLCLFLSCAAASADGVSFWSSGTTGSVNLPTNSGLVTTILSASIGMNVSTYGYTSASTGSSSFQLSNSYWSANFGPMSGSAWGDGPWPIRDPYYSQVDVYEYAKTDYRIQNTTNRAMGLSMWAWLSMPDAYGSHIWEDGWGWASVQSGFSIATPSNATGITNLTFTCNSGQGLPDTGFCQTGISAFGSTVGIYSPDDSYLSAFEGFTLPAFGTLDIDLSAYVEGNAYNNNYGYLPEPGTWCLLGSGVLLIGFLAWKRLTAAPILFPSACL